MAFRPVFLTELVRANPPSQTHISMCIDPMKRALALRNATLGCALYLAEVHDYILMQDRTGGVWVQHKRSPMIMTPPGGLIFKVKGEPLPYQRWLCSMHKAVRQQGRTGLDPKLSFRRGVQRLYGDHFKDNQPTKTQPLGPTSKRSALKALNPYIAHRTWISKFLGGLGFTQMVISSLTKGLWQRETRKALWSNIARLYTYARNEDQQGLVLGDFMRAELIRNSQDPSPRTFLLGCGINIDEMRKQLVPNYSKFDAQMTIPSIPTPSIAAPITIAPITIAPNISAPNILALEWAYPRTTVVSNVYFTKPANIEIHEELDTLPLSYVDFNPMDSMPISVANEYSFHFEEFVPKSPYA